MSATQKLLRFGVFELNLDTVEVRKAGAVVKLSPQPFKLLALLAAHAGQIVTREEIQAELWGEETYVDFEHGVNKCIKQIRTVLGDDADKPLYIETLPRQGYRFLAPVVSKTIAAPGPRVVESQSSERARPPALTAGGGMPATIAGAAAPSYAVAAAKTDAVPAAQPEAGIEPTSADAIQQPRPRFWRRRPVWIVAAAVIVVAALAVLYPHVHFVTIKYADLMRIKQAELTEKDSIVLADFENKTGDPVFDDTLKQALAIQLEQSTFLNVLSDAKVGETLKLMDRPAGERLTEAVTHEVCLRSNSKAMLIGSIAALGNQYVIGLRAIDCNSGDLLADAQRETTSKESVIKALDLAALSLRKKLGESLGSVQKYATPLPEATTSSLEALQAYSEGVRTARVKGDAAALPFDQRAVELDPDFALAYADMASCYGNLNEAERAAENARKAYELRGKVTERERFVIDTDYYELVTGQLEKAAEVYELWQQTYPRDVLAPGNLGIIYGALGNWEGALEEARVAMHLEPDNAAAYGNLGNAYVNLNRLDDAEAVYKQAENPKLQSEFLLANRYLLAFLRGDTPQMAQLVAAASGKPGMEDLLLAIDANTEAWHGRLERARALTRRAMDSAEHNDAKEAAALYQAALALSEAAADDRERARADAEAALKLAPTRDVREPAALVLAQVGETARAEKLAADLDKSFPLDTLVQRYWLPMIRAAVALQRKDPGQAIEHLNIATPIELGGPSAFNVYLSPVYLRGQSYLMRHDGKAAAAEFRKFVDHYGLVGNFPWGALARLGLARAYALQAADDPAARDKARAAYQSFLTIWNDADPKIPIYQQAKAEAPKLQ